MSEMVTVGSAWGTAPRAQKTVTIAVHSWIYRNYGIYMYKQEEEERHVEVVGKEGTHLAG